MTFGPTASGTSVARNVRFATCAGAAVHGHLRLLIVHRADDDVVDVAGDGDGGLGRHELIGRRRDGHVRRRRVQRHLDAGGADGPGGVVALAVMMFGPSASGSAMLKLPFATGAGIELIVTVAVGSSTVPLTVVGLMLR